MVTTVARRRVQAPAQVRIPDKDGNEILINNGRSILLRLRGERKARRIGEINSKKQLVVHRKRIIHLHYKSQSYGFNHYIIDNAKKFNKVLLIDERGSYLIPNKVILEKGEFLYFKQVGFELQIFLSLEIINQYKLN